MGSASFCNCNEKTTSCITLRPAWYTVPAIFWHSYHMTGKALVAHL
jgi:hypothetical protein